MKVLIKLTPLALLAATLSCPADANEAAWNKYTMDGAKAYESGNFGHQRILPEACPGAMAVRTNDLLLLYAPGKYYAYPSSGY